MSYTILIVIVSVFVALVSTQTLHPYTDCPVFTFGGSPSHAQTSSSRAIYSIQEDESLIRESMINLYKHIQPPTQASNHTLSTAHCTYLSVPLNRKVQDSPSINVFVKRLPAPRSPAKGALFFLQGGPGGNSAVFEGIMLAFQAMLPDYDTYYLEHRGVGRSKRLGCHISQSETQGSDRGVAITHQEASKYCASELGNSYQDTHVYGTTEAAQDLRDLIATVTNVDNQPYEKKVIYGVSYGTFWLNRFLQLPNAPFDVDQIILDGLVSQAGTPQDSQLRLTFDQWDFRMNQVGFDIIRVCDQQKFCSEHLKEKVNELGQADPKNKFEYTNAEEFVKLVFDQVFNLGRCSKDGVIEHLELTEPQLKNLLGQMTMSLESRAVIPALLLRILRCDPDLDQPVLKHIHSTLVEQEQAALDRTMPPLDSDMILRHIGYNELWNADLDPSHDYLMSIFNSSYFATAQFPVDNEFAIWPKYEEPYVKHTPQNIQIPILMLNGDLDPQTPLIFAEAQYNNTRETCPNAHLIRIPYANHATAFRGNFSDVPEGRPYICGLDLMLQFILKGGMEGVDTSCTERMYAPDFEKGESAAFNELVFGTKDIWEGTVIGVGGTTTVGLYTFIGVVAGILLISIIVICGLIYYIVQLKDKHTNYKDLDDEYEPVEGQ